MQFRRRGAGVERKNGRERGPALPALRFQGTRTRTLSHDRGSIRKRGDAMPNLKIDNVSVDVPEGTSILEAARKSGFRIPSLCYLEKVQAIGACRVCLVEVEGTRALVASCVTPVTENMRVRTNTKRVRDA